MKIVTTSPSELCLKIAAAAQIPIIIAQKTIFNDTEIALSIHTDLENQSVLVMNHATVPIHDQLIELLLLIQRIKQHKAKQIIAVVPYLGYSRQNTPFTKDTSHSPLSFLTQCIGYSGADYLMVADLHAPLGTPFEESFVQHLTAISIFAQDIHQRFVDNYVLIAPDQGSQERIKQLAKILQKPLIVLDKTRLKPLAPQDYSFDRKKTYIIVDDIVDSGHTLCNAAVALAEAGACEIHGYATHGVLSKGLNTFLEDSLCSLTLSDSIQRCEQLPSQKLRFLSLAPLFTPAILKLNLNK